MFVNATPQENRFEEIRNLSGVLQSPLSSNIQLKMERNISYKPFSTVDDDTVRETA
jgi:hypothetical protein